MYTIRIKLSDKVAVCTVRVVDVVRNVGKWLCEFIYPNSDGKED